MSSEQNSNGVQIEQFEPQPVVSIRATVRIDQLGEAMGDRIQALGAYLKQSGAQPAGPPYVRYHTFGETETDLETGIPVREPVSGEGRINGGELPGGRAVTTWHFGAHDKMGDAYARIDAFMSEQGYEPNGPAWEVYYWIDPTQELDPSSWDPTTWRTQLIQPIR